MSCALVAFSGWKTLIPRPWMCVGNVTVTLLELSMEARRVHRYTLHNIHTHTHTHLLTSPFIRYTLLVLDLTPFSHYFNLFVKFDVCFFLSLPLVLFTCVSSFRWEDSVSVRLLWLVASVPSVCLVGTAWKPLIQRAALVVTALTLASPATLQGSPLATRTLDSAGVKPMS